LINLTPGVLPTKKKVVPNVKMRQLQWNKIPNNVVTKTIWKKLTEEESLRAKIDLVEFESLFGVKAGKNNVQN
jgi:hypothetical protein